MGNHGATATASNNECMLIFVNEQVCCLSKHRSRDFHNCVKHEASYIPGKFYHTCTCGAQKYGWVDSNVKAVVKVIKTHTIDLKGFTLDEARALRTVLTNATVRRIAGNVVNNVIDELTKAIEALDGGDDELEEDED